jgi:hypothetical protein
MGETTIGQIKMLKSYDKKLYYIIGTMQELPKARITVQINGINHHPKVWLFDVRKLAASPLSFYSSITLPRINTISQTHSLQ